MVPAVPLRVTGITRLTTPGHVGNILVQGTGAPTTAYHIEFSPDLSPNSFGSAVPVNSDSNGALQYEDNPGNLTKRFDRFTFP